MKDEMKYQIMTDLDNRCPCDYFLIVGMDNP